MGTLAGASGWGQPDKAASQEGSLGGWRDELVQASRQQSQVNVALGGHVLGNLDLQQFQASFHPQVDEDL